MQSEANRVLFEEHHNKGHYFTFDDVLLKPAHSSVLPANADTSTRLSRNYTLNTPIISAAMGTVTEAAMAIAVAEEGGCGVVHRDGTPEWHAEQIVRVKLSRSGFVGKPKTVRVDSKVGDLLMRLEERKSAGKNIFHSFPVVDQDERVVGLIGRNDIERYKNFKDTRIGDIMTPYDKLFRGEPGMETDAAYKKLQQTRWSVLPLIEEKSRKLCGMYVFEPLQRMFESDSSRFNIDKYGRLVVAGAVSTGKEECARAELLMQHGVNLIVIDASHGDSEAVGEMVKQCKRIAGNQPVDIIGGNIATAEGAKYLLDAGSDAVKVGVGPGSICTTRQVTGFGVPQLSAIWEVAAVAASYNVPVIGDGGAKTSGDIVKAIVAGADCVMLGTMLASTDETPGESYVYQGVRVKDYRGMGSPTSILQRPGQLRYSQIGVSVSDIAAQGVDGIVPYRGSVARLLRVYTNGIQSGMGLAGARTITELQERAEFIEISPNGLAESRVHDVIVPQ